MTPVAFHIGSLQIYWYGICMAFAFLTSYGVASYLAPKRSLPNDVIGDLLTWTVVGGLGGARLLFVIQNADQYLDNPLRILNFREGGLVFYGGFVCATLVVAWRAKARKLAPWSVADVLAVAVPMGHAIGRIGCFLHGCCHGRPYYGACAIRYATSPDVSYLPIQLVAAAGNVCLALFLLLLFHRKTLKGRIFPIYAMLYAILRFSTEFGRGDYGTRPGGLTPAQWVCFLIFPAGVALWRYTGTRQPQAENPDSA
jgi:phosphatidylglycerol---prolipoprotein diacylglyceryl transferase